MTELLSPFHLLRRGPVLRSPGWWCWRSQRSLRPPPQAAAYRHPPRGSGHRGWHRGDRGRSGGSPPFVSPPNSADAMAYHMPRVIYWAQAGSVAFFPTPYFNQICLQPLAEYFALHTYLLSGGDRFVNLVACAAFLASIVGVSALAGALGAAPADKLSRRSFAPRCPTGSCRLPAPRTSGCWPCGSSARRISPPARRAVHRPLARPGAGHQGHRLPVRAAAAARRAADSPAAATRAAAWRWIAAGVLLVNTPQYVRNLRLSGSPLGYDSAQGDGVFRWRNEHPGWRSTVSNSHPPHQRTTGRAAARAGTRRCSTPRWRSTARWASTPATAILPGPAAILPAAECQSRSRRQQPLAPASAGGGRRSSPRSRASARGLSTPRPARGAPAVLFLPEVAALRGASGAAAVRAGRAAGRALAGGAAAGDAGPGGLPVPAEHRPASAVAELDPPAHRPAFPLRRHARRQLLPRHGAVEQPRLLS